VTSHEAVCAASSTGPEPGAPGARSPAARPRTFRAPQLPAHKVKHVIHVLTKRPKGSCPETGAQSCSRSGHRNRKRSCSEMFGGLRSRGSSHGHSSWQRVRTCTAARSWSVEAGCIASPAPESGARSGEARLDGDLGGGHSSSLSGEGARLSAYKRFETLPHYALCDLTLRRGNVNLRKGMFGELARWLR